MRRLTAVAIASFVCLPLFAQTAGIRVEYGKPLELRNAKTVFISTLGDPDLKAEVRQQLSQAFPAMTFEDSEEAADVVVHAVRKLVDGAQKESGTLTTAGVARELSGGTVRVYVDATSRQAQLSDAVREVLAPVLLLFQQANPRRYGRPDPDALADAALKAKVHSTAGLRPGLNKRDVLAAIGQPTRVLKGSSGDIWSYDTTDGTMRLVFRGDFLLSSTLAPKK